METVYQVMSDGVAVAGYEWKTETKPRAVIHIVHGMSEHALRYAEFAEKAKHLGFAVFASDHRGHGNTAKEKGLFGFLAEKDGFFRVVEDQREINAELQKKYPNTPIIILGHSFGSFISQNYIENYGDSLTGCILSGSAGPNPSVPAGSIVANLVCMIRGRKKVSKFLDSLSFGAFNKAIENPKTEYDWLSRDEASVQKYIDDELCGFSCTAGFYQDLLRGLKKTHKAKEMARIPKNLPVLILGGSKDPVSNSGKTLKKLFSIYKNNGMQSVEFKLYEDARHELLNEVNNEEVIRDIFHWIEETLDNA